MKKALTISLVLLFGGGVAMADDFDPPNFRGYPLSYMAQWDMFTAGDFSAGIVPDLESSVDDADPATYLYDGIYTHLDFDSEDGWALTVGGGGGIYNPQRDATFAANVINWVDWLPEKDLRVQMTYTDDGNGPPSITGVTGHGPVSGGEPHTSESLASSGYGGTQRSWIYSIYPNPDWEQIEFFLPQGTIVEQIVIDSISMPEPATLALLLLGGLALLRRKARA